jgi:large subunit ribosomal protein L3
MTQIFTEDGLTLPVTIVKAGPCLVTELRNTQKHGYEAVQVGYALNPKKELNKPEAGHLGANNLEGLHYLKEYRVDDSNVYKLKQTITVESFEIGSLVNVTGKSIGKGFSGNQKRHNFKRGPMSHGSKNHRAPGSIGPGTTPGRVLPGKKMPGQYGSKQVTITKLKVLGVSKKHNLLVLKGSLPGKPGTLLSVVPSKQ